MSTCIYFSGIFALGLSIDCAFLSRSDRSDFNLKQKPALEEAAPPAGAGPDTNLWLSENDLFTACDCHYHVSSCPEVQPWCFLWGKRWLSQPLCFAFLNIWKMRDTLSHLLSKHVRSISMFGSSFATAGWCCDWPGCPVVKRRPRR